MIVRTPQKQPRRIRANDAHEFNKYYDKAKIKQTKSKQNCLLATRSFGKSLYSLSDKPSYRQIAWSLDAARLDVIMIVSL